MFHSVYKIFLFSNAVAFFSRKYLSTILLTWQLWYGAALLSFPWVVNWLSFKMYQEWVGWWHISIVSVMYKIVIINSSKITFKSECTSSKSVWIFIFNTSYICVPNFNWLSKLQLYFYFYRKLQRANDELQEQVEGLQVQLEHLHSRYLFYWLSFLLQLIVFLSFCLIIFGCLSVILYNHHLLQGNFSGSFEHNYFL